MNSSANSSANPSANPWPTELRLRKDRKTLTVVFDDGETFDLPAEYLRVCSPSAEVQGHSPSERRTVGGKQNVEILEVHPVGNYAVRLSIGNLNAPARRSKKRTASARGCGTEAVLMSVGAPSKCPTPTLPP